MIEIAPIRSLPLRGLVANSLAPRSGERGGVRGLVRNRDRSDQVAARRARAFRLLSTTAEHRLWQRLRSRQLAQAKFRRQAPVGPYIVDFICLDAGLVIEIDGSQHAENAGYDLQRTQFLERQGLRVIRFWNNEVLENLQGVLDRIRDALP